MLHLWSLFASLMEFPHNAPAVLCFPLYPPGSVINHHPPPPPLSLGWGPPPENSRASFKGWKSFLTSSHHRSVLIRWTKWALPNRAVLVWPLPLVPPFSWAHWGADKMSWNAICRPSVHYPEQHFLLSLGWRLSFVSQLSAGQNSSACLLFLVCIYNAVATEAGSVSIHLSCYLVSGMGLALWPLTASAFTHSRSLQLGSN